MKLRLEEEIKIKAKKSLGTRDKGGSRKERYEMGQCKGCSTSI